MSYQQGTLVIVDMQHDFFPVRLTTDFCVGFGAPDARREGFEVTPIEAVM